MADSYESAPLWLKTLAANSADNELTAKAREKLRAGYFEFRKRVALLVGQIQKELPDLTLHDITHVDALWGVASEVTGKDYPLNPAEAFVLGGAFLLHDAAHSCASFKGGLEEIKQTDQWKAAAVARGLDPATVTKNDPQYAALLFEALRTLHPIQAEQLPFAVWGDTPESASFLLPDEDLRNAFGHVIGAVAKSHWSYPHELEAWRDEVTTTPVCLSGTGWQVDWLKVAVLLRVADALHMDSQRAPAFLLKIAPPSNATSRLHWDFQSHLNMIACDAERQEIRITGTPFAADKQAAWWQAYDTARMADKELDAAYYLLRDNAKSDRPLLAAREVAGVRSPEAFARYVKVKDWTPVDTEVRITQVQQLVQNFGGEKLYGDKPHLALRELLQNAIDAVHACRQLGGLGAEEGEIEVALDEPVDGKQWLHVTDTGIGMSKYVLTQVLLDFGRSLWRSGDLKGEWSGLAASGFDAIGQFGIGFFSVFMLGEQVRVTTWRYEHKSDEPMQWTLEFSKGTKQRPVLREPQPNEKLNRHGTKVSVLVTNEILKKMAGKESDGTETMLAALAPAIDVNMHFKSDQLLRKMLVEANDWKSLTEQALAKRLSHQIVGLSYFLGSVPYLSPIFGEAGEQLGRIGIADWHNSGVGLVQGLYAGAFAGFSGTLQCKPQADLARSDATPIVSRKQITTWASQHLAVLKANSQLGFTSSAWLAYYGAPHTDLVLGELCGEDVTDEELSVWLDPSEKYELFIYKGDLDFDEDEDIPKSEHSHFEPTSNFMRVCELGIPKWLQLLQPYVQAVHDVGFFREVSCSPLLESVKATVLKAWGDGCEWTEKNVTIGYINEHAICRTCLVARRVSPLDN